MTSLLAMFEHFNPEVDEGIQEHNHLTEEPEPI